MKPQKKCFNKRFMNFLSNTILAFTLTVLSVFYADTSTVSAQQKTVKSDIDIPNGYERKTYPEGSFSTWLQNLPLKSDNIVLNYRGGQINSFYNVLAVAEIPLLFNSDLEQCADYCMRLWAEYHKSLNKLDRLYLFEYNGNKRMYTSDGRSYRDFLRWVFSYSNSYSLKRGCKEVIETELQPGDMFVQNQTGSIGHVCMIVDACESPYAEKLYLIGYSFMPAQEFHIEKAGDEYGKSGWFTLEGFLRYLQDQLPFGPAVYRRFESL